VKTFLPALRLLAALTLLTGVLYPLAVWTVGRLCFPYPAGGSLLTRNSQLVGSALLAQKTTDPRYFAPRPSAGDYATVASGASNLAWTSAKRRQAVVANEQQYRELNQIPAATAVPADAITTSGSGLDPDMTPVAVRHQAGQVAAARKFTPAQRDALDRLIARQIEGGHITPGRINILRLNLALDTAFPSP
jgi:potassium-transporting ATPase KdpC subunit